MIPLLVTAGLALIGGYLTQEKKDSYAKGGMLNADDWSVGMERYGTTKRYFLYNQKTGQIKGFYTTRREAEQKISRYYYSDGGDIGDIEIAESEIEIPITEKINPTLPKKGTGSNRGSEVGKSGSECKIGKYRVYGDLRLLDNEAEIYIDVEVLATSEEDALKKVMKPYQEVSPDSDILVEIIEIYE